MMKKTEAIKVCTIFGQPDVKITQTLYNATAVYLANAVILNNCRIFYFASNGDFEAVCRYILTAIKEDHPEIQLFQVFCTLAEEEGVTSRPYFNREDYDRVVALPLGSFETELYDRLYTIINNSAMVISYLEKRNKSDFYRAYKYAKKQKDKHVVNLYDTVKFFTS